MTVTVFKSTDASAPVLTGLAGSLVSLLDAIFVNGYGSKTALGWTKSYSGTNAASYRQKSGTNQRYLDVADTTQGFSRVVAYEVMTALATGTNPFPNSSQFSGGEYFMKSVTTDSTARPWVCYSNGAFFYLLSSSDQTSLATPGAPGTLFFGDFTSYLTTAETYNTYFSANNSGSTGLLSTTLNHSLAINYSVNPTAPTLGGYACRGSTGAGTSQQVSRFTNGALFGVTSLAGTVCVPGSLNAASASACVPTPLAYPNAADAGLYMERQWIFETTPTNTIRGELPGIWCPMHNLPLNHLDTFNGTGVMAGKSFEGYRFTTGGAGQGEVFFETSSTW